MIISFIVFECRLRRRLLSTYIYAAALFAAGCFMMWAEGGIFRGLSVNTGREHVHANSPYVLFGTTSGLCLLGLLMVAAVFGQAAYRDFGYDTWTLIFSKNVRHHQYLVGRFLGAFVFSAALLAAVGAGEFCASLVLAIAKPDRVGSTQLLAFAWPYLVQVWPLLLFSGGLFFSLAALTRRMAAVYVAAVVLVLGYVTASALAKDVEARTISALLDPCGFVAFELATRYWTAAERNRDLVPVASLLGVNRLLWSAVGVGFLLFAVRRFRSQLEEQPAESQAELELGTAPETDYPQLTAATTRLGWWPAVLATVRIYLSELLQSGVYWSLVLSGLAFMLLAFGVSKDLYGTATLPVTYQVLEMTRNSFGLFNTIVLIYYAGEFAFRERDAGLQDVCDATRAPTWVLFCAKLLALFGVALSLAVVMAVTALLTQVTRGFFHVDLGLYALELLVIAWTELAFIASLAFVLQVLIQHKYLGHFAMVGYYVSTPVLTVFGSEDLLLRYGAMPDVRYSDMNGFGSLLGPWFWYRLYWSSAALLLIALAYRLMPRGRAREWAVRFREGRSSFGLLWKTGVVVGALSWAASGTYIFYNTHVLNRFLPEERLNQLRAQYEHRYRAWLDTPQPRIVSAHVRLDVMPERESLAASGRYGLVNKTSATISRVMVLLPDDVIVRRLSVAGADKPAGFDPGLGVRVFDLPKVLAPGARADLEFDLLFEPHGFRHVPLIHPEKHPLVQNGTFFNNSDLPIIGYLSAIELTAAGDRQQHGLAPRPHMAARNDKLAAQNSYIRQDSDYIEFSADVSTSPDQIAIAPGYVQRRWQERGRNYTRFAMDQPILNFFSVLSARYAVVRDHVDDIALEIYHHPSHTYNLKRMLQGMKDALRYCTTQFGPYPYRQARIVEFPRYVTLAQAFPNTIPYSEAIGFIARVRDDDPNDVNFPYYVTAHEIAHAWWGHQIAGANVRGATMTSETLAQYSALMVMKHTYQPGQMRRFLSYELDSYLTGRTHDRNFELALAFTEDQPYVHYHKGSLAMYALQDYIGEERVNRALRAFIEAWKLRGPPYATSKDLLDYLRAETPEEYRYLIHDLFETITLYDNHVRRASTKLAPGGGWDVQLEVVARKLRSKGDGTVTELKFSDYIDVGALDAAGNVAYLMRQKLSTGPTKLQFHMATRPAKVGIDPLHKLIDRTPDDNIMTPD